MRRFIPPLLIAAGVFLSCQPDQQPPTSPPVGSPTADVSDAFHGVDGNSHFMWLPELVESPPHVNGDFNPNLMPEIRICELDVTWEAGEDPPDEGVAQCDPNGLNETLFSSSEIQVSDHYSAVWHTRDSDLNASSSLYRLIVWVAGREIGYRDVAPKLTPQEVPSNPKTSPFYAFNDDNTINIKFRIEYGFFCEAIGAGPDCGEGVLTAAGGGAITNPDATVGLNATLQGNAEDAFVAVEFLSQCEGEGADPNIFQVDIEQFGQCVRITTERTLTEGEIAPLATVGACVSVNANVDSHELYMLRGANVGTDEVFVLPHRDANGFLSCDVEVGLSENKYINFAQRGWRTLKRMVNPLDAVPVYAGHSGRGGGTPEFSVFNWGLLTEMAKVPGVGEGETVVAGTVLQPTVHVTTFEDVGGETEEIDAANNTITFEITDGSGGCIAAVGDPCTGSGPIAVITGTDGLASVTWVPGPTGGLYNLDASAVGVGLRIDNIGSGLQSPPVDDQRQLEESTLTFTVDVCQICIDGIKSPGEWDNEISVPFTANVSGGPNPNAAYYWKLVDGELFFAVEVPLDDQAATKFSTLSLYLSSAAWAGGLSLSTGDDVLIVDGQIADKDQRFSDMFWSDDCPKGKSFCAILDDSPGNQNGEGAVEINSDGNGGFFLFFEVSHELGGPALQDISDTGHLSQFFTLRLGNGKWGNTVSSDDFGTYDPLVP